MVLVIQAENSSAPPSWSVYRYMIAFNSQSVCYQILELLQLPFNWCVFVILIHFMALLCHRENSVYFSLCKLSFLCNHLAPGGGLIQLTNISKHGKIIIITGNIYCQYVWTLNIMLMYWQFKVYNRTIGHRNISAMCRRLVDETKKECMYLIVLHRSLLCKPIIMNFLWRIVNISESNFMGWSETKSESEEKVLFER